jgi:hypothetical protein
MLRTLLCFTFVLMGSLHGMAQTTKADSVLKKAKKTRIDTLINPIDKKIDKVDSVNSKANAALNKLQNVNLNTTLTLPDSLKPNTAKYTNKVDSVKRRLSTKIDSLTTLKLPTAKYTKLLDSLNKSAPVKKIQQAQAGLQKLEKKVNSPIEKVNAKLNEAGSKVNAKLNELNKEGLDLPEGVKVPNASGVTTPGLGALPGANTPNLTTGSKPSLLPGMPTVNPNTNVVQQELQKITSLPQKEISQLKNAGALGDATKGLSQVKQISTQAKTYTQEIQSVSAGDLSNAKNISKELEARASSIGEVKELQTQTNMLDQYKAMAAKGNNPEELKKLAQEQVKKEAINHFAGKEQLLLGAMDQLSKYKLKHPTATEVKAAFKGVYNEMSGKPLRVRLVPGFNLQFRTASDFSIDYNPFIAYRISGKWSAGLGWVERTQFHSFISTVPTGRVFGPRLFTDVYWKKGFSFRGEAERINNFVAASQVFGQAEDGRQWSWNFFVGVKKEYKFTKHIKGNIQVLYNVGHYIRNTNAYGDKLNVRMGFDFSLKKRK